MVSGGAAGTLDEHSPHLRLTVLRPLDIRHDLDDHLRRWMATAAVQPGHRWTLLGRRTAESTEEHIVASLWSTLVEQERAFEMPEIRSLEQTFGTRVAGSETEVLPVRICETFVRDTPMTIMRVFRGWTYPGQLPAYLAEAQAGTVLDGQREDGPGSLACATDGATGFVTVSLWPGWPSIEACTGGDIQHPLLTRNRSRLAGGAPTHYELVAYTQDASRLASVSS